MRPTLLLKPFALLAAGAAIGFAAGDQFGSSPTRTGASGGSPPALAADAAPGAQRAVALGGGSLSSALDTALNEPDKRKRVRTLHRLLDGLDPKEIPKALEHLRARRANYRFIEIELNLLSDWAAVDPAAALAFAETLDGQQHFAAISSVFTAWFKKDRAAAQAWLDHLPPGERRNAAEHGMLNALAAENPAQALEMLKHNPALGNRGAWNTFFNNLAAHDPRKAIELALSLSPGKNQADAISALASSWGLSDPVAALSWVKQLPAGPTRQQALGRTLSMLAWKDPAEAVKVAMEELPSGWQKYNAVSQALGKWMEKDAAAARAWAEKLPPGDLRNRALSSVVATWAKSDPQGALRYVMESPDGQAHQSMLQTTLVRWISNDPKSGLQWLDENAATIKPNTLSNLLTSLSYQNSEAAATLLSRIPEGDLRNRNARNVGSQWAASDPAAANTWYERMPEGPAREQFLRGMISAIGRYDAPAASEKIERLSEGTIRDQATTELASTWAQSDPRAAFEWVANTASEKAFEGAIGNIAAQWAGQDPDGAADWLNTIPAGKLRDNAVQQFSIRALSDDPKTAALWATSIGNESSRRMVLSIVMSRWSANDKEAAQAWLAAAPVPQEWKTSLIPKP